MNHSQKEKLRQIAQRSEQINRSRQPRNNPLKDKQSAGNFFTSTYNWVKKAELVEPPYIPDSRTKDAWLREFTHQEPHLAGVISTAVSIDSNRGYTLIGGRNQVVRFSRILKNVEGGLGWRELKILGAQDFYTTNMGQITETETDGKNGPLVSLYHVDSARCRLTPDPNYPLTYYPLKGIEQNWKPEWYYRVSSMLSPDEKYNRLGYCAANRAVKLAQIMIALIEYDIEKLNTLAPNGLVMIESDSLTQESWDNAMNQHAQIVVGKKGNDRFDRAIVIVDRAIKGDVLEFSSIPDGFNPFTFTDYMMKAYALAFNMPTRYFWDVSAGGLGSGNEVAAQMERASYAGGASYAKADQEELQKILPSSLLFTYDFDDREGQIKKAETLKIWTDAGKGLMDLGMSGENVLGLMVKEGIIDSEFTPMVEETITDDDDNTLRMTKEHLLESETVQRAISKYPDEPIVRYSYPTGKITTLWQAGNQAIKKYHVVEKPKIRYRTKDDKIIVHRQTQPETVNQLVNAAQNGEMPQEEFETRLDLYMQAALMLSFMLSWTGSPNDQELEIIDLAESIINNAVNGNLVNLELEVEDMNSLADLLVPAAVLTQLGVVNGYNEDSSFGDDLFSGRYDDSPEESLNNRIGLWVGRLAVGAVLGGIFLKGGSDEDTGSWFLGGTERHCSTCLEMASVSPQPRSFWIEKAAAGIYPQSGTGLECGGWHCDCALSISV